MAYTSPSTINASRGITEIITYVNDVSNNWFGNMILISVWILFFMGYLISKGDDDLIGAMSVSSYVTFVLGTLMFAIGFVDIVAYMVVIGVTMISSIILYANRN